MLKTTTVAAAAALLAALPAHAVEFIALDSKATYLHTSNENPPAPAAYALDLAAHGYAAGDTIHLQATGTFDFGPGGEVGFVSGGIFSSSTTLLAPTQLNRVAGALASDAPAFVSAPTYWGGEATDTPYDFRIDDVGVDVKVPVGASVLFLAAHDSWYQDNSDSNHDFGILLNRVSPVPEPASAVLALGGLALLGSRLRRRASAT